MLVKSSGRYLLNDNSGNLWELRAGLVTGQYLTFFWIVYLKIKMILALFVELKLGV